MLFKKKPVLIAALLVTTATGAWAECGIEKGSIRILSNDFAALHAIANAAETCASDTVTVTRNQTENHKNIQVPALTTNPATYTVAMVATNSVVPLMNEGLVRPLDEYVEKWGQGLQDSQLIRVDGKVMAVAFMANGQHLVYREDILADNGIEVPTSYDELFAAAEKLREAGVMEAPISAGFKPGWDLAAEFVNTYLGTGAEFFEPGSAALAINNEQGLATLENMKNMVGYMSQDWATYDSNAQKPVWESGEVAFSINWGSRAGSLIADDSPSPDIAATTRFAAAPTVHGGTIPSAALWWDGFTIAKNISDEDAEASFRAMMVGIAPATAKANPEAAVWLAEGYEPTPAAVGVVADLQGGARPYPMLPYMGLLHTTLGDNLAEFLQGKETAEQALADVSTAYTTAATEAGFLN